MNEIVSLLKNHNKEYNILKLSWDKDICFFFSSFTEYTHSHTEMQTEILPLLKFAI